MSRRFLSPLTVSHTVVAASFGVSVRARTYSKKPCEQP